MRPLLDNAVELLRHALNAKLEGFQQAFEQQQSLLQADADWKELSAAQREDLSATHHLAAPAAVLLGSTERIEDALDDCDLDHWVSRTLALPNRFETVRYAAVQLLKPNVVHVTLPKRTLNDVTELEAWLVEVGSLLREKLGQGPVSL